MTDPKIVLSAVDKTQAAFDSVQRGLNGVGATGKKVQAIFTGFDRLVGITALSGFFGAGLVAAPVAFAVNVSKAGEEVARLSQLANSSTDAFQRMAYGAGSVGVANDKLADILKDVNDKVGEVVGTGGGPLKDFFDKVAPAVGVTADQFARLSGPEALQLYFDSLQKANLGQQQMTTYMEMIASDSTALIPLLRDGGAGFRELGDQAERFGLVMDDEAIAKSREFQKHLRDLEGIMTGLRNTIGVEVIPVINRLSAEFLLGIKYSDGFFDALTRYGLSNPFDNLAGKLAVLRNEFEQIDFRLSNDRSTDRGADEARLRALEQEIGYYTEIQKLRAGGDKQPPVIVPTTRTLPDLTDRKTKPDRDRDPLGDFAQRALADYEASLERLREKYIDLIDPLQKFRDQLAEIDMLRAEGQLTTEQAALAEQHVHAAMDDTITKMAEVADTGKDRFEDLTRAIDSWGNRAADTFADFAVSGKASFSDLVESILADIVRLQAKQIFDPIVSQGAGLFGGFVSSLFGGGAAQSFSGGGIATGPASGYPATLHGTEAVIPIPNGAVPVRLMGGQGGGTQVVVNVSNAAPEVRASARSSTDASGGAQLDIVIERVETGIGRRMAQGDGLAPLMERRYGLNPAAGARR